MPHHDLRIDPLSVAGMTDEELCWAVVEPIWPDNTIIDELEHLSTMTPGQRAVYVTMLFAREVDNGGVRQFLLNSSNLYYEAVLHSLQLIGATKLQEGFQEVLMFFPDAKISPDRADRKRAMAAFSEQQRQKVRQYEDQVFSKGGFEENLRSLWVWYIQRHSGQFFLGELVR